MAKPIQYQNNCASDHESKINVCNFLIIVSTTHNRKYEIMDPKCVLTLIIANAFEIQNFTKLKD